MNELLCLPYSPWSEKARWALDARAVPYVARIYQPLIGEPALRFRTRRWRGRVSVPVLTDEDGGVHTDSADIARFADARGDGPTLFPAEHEAEIARFIDISERALSAGRARSLERMLRDDEALLEMVPRPLQRPLGPIAIAIAAGGVRRTLRKYAATSSSASEHEHALVVALDALRAAIPASRGPLLGALTFADIAATQMLAFVSPPAFGLRVGPASRRTFHDPEVAERYGDLVDWRDAIYDAHRGRIGGEPAA